MDHVRNFRILPLIVLLMVTGGCSATRQPPENESHVKTTIRVVNNNWLDMNIYVLSGPQRLRLGTVTGVSTQIFVIPDYAITAATLRFVADPVGAAAQSLSQEK